MAITAAESSATSTPEGLASNDASITGFYLRSKLLLDKTINAGGNT